MEMPFLDKTTPEDFGKIKFIGDDNKGNKIYSLGTKYSKMGELLKDIAKLQGVEDQYMFVCTSPYVNNTLRIGGWLSRAVSLPAIGRPLVVRGLKMAYTALCSFVETNAIKLKGTQQ
jgi:hypothetical protein